MLVELGRYDRNLANIIVARLASDGIPAFAFDNGTSIAEGSWLLIPVRVMIDEDDLDRAVRRWKMPLFEAASRICTKTNIA